MLHSIPCLSVSDTSVTLYHTLVDENGKRINISRRGINKQHLINNQVENNLSRKAKTRLKKSINALFIYAREQQKKLSFITLTLPAKQKTADKDVNYRLLKQLFIELEQKELLTAYVWKKEKQLNGNVHYHIVSDCIIKHNDLRKLWNRILSKDGYISDYQNKMSGLTFSQYCNLRKKDIEKGRFSQVKEAYINGVKSNWENPNTIDIHSLYKDKNGKKIASISKYLIKYMCKDDKQAEKTNERIWFANRLITEIRDISIDCDSDIALELDYLNAKNGTFSTDYTITYFYTSIDEIIENCPCMYDSIINHIKTKLCLNVQLCSDVTQNQELQPENGETKTQKQLIKQFQMYFD